MTSARNPALVVHPAVYLAPLFAGENEVHGGHGETPPFAAAAAATAAAPGPAFAVSIGATVLFKGSLL